MQKIKYLLVFCAITLLTTAVSAQAFSGKGAKIIQLSLGLSEHNAWYPENGKGPKGNVNPLSGNFHVQAEFGIGKYVGLGGSIGFDYASNLSRNSVGYGLYASSIIGAAYGSSNFRSFAIPITITANFHFFQLIQDKTEKSIHADKLDVYVGLDFGSGVAFADPKKGCKSLGSDVGYMIFGGPHVGAKYFLNDRTGLLLELGYGKTYLNGGVVFKF